MIKLMRFTVIMSLFVFSSSRISHTAAASLPEDRWLYGAVGYARAIELQRELNVPLVVYFYADWCPYCRTLDNQYLPAAPVQEYLRRVVKVRINPEQGKAEYEIAARYGVKGYPTFLIMNHASSSPRNVNPFRRGGSNLTPDQFANACQQSRSVSTQTPSKVIGLNGSPAPRTDMTTRAVMNATRQTRGAQIVEVAPSNAALKPTENAQPARRRNQKPRRP